MIPIISSSSLSTPVIPRPFSEIVNKASFILAELDTNGISSPVWTSWSKVRSRRFPSIPPGWSSAKSSLLNPRISNKATANASPIAKVAVVLAVGARSRVQASFSTDVSRYISDLFAKVEFCRPISPIIVTPFLCIAGRIWINSMVSPLLLTMSNISFLVIMPRSP